MDQLKSNPYALLRPGAGNLFGILIITFLVMILIVGFIQQWIISIIPDYRTAFLIGSVLQDLLAFVFPTFLTCLLCIKFPFKYLGITTPIPPGNIFLIVSLAIFIIPIENLIIDWNANITFPDSMKTLEEQLRLWEESAADITEKILSDNSIAGLLSGILVVGCITGFSEELFFRAGILRSFIQCKINVHISVWATALIFSFMHFQFFGFVPRTLLGALMGYIYIYSGSFWLCAFFHALSNSIVVVTAWLSANHINMSFLEQAGVGGGIEYLLDFMSLAISILIIIMLAKNPINLRISPQRHQKC